MTGTWATKIDVPGQLALSAGGVAVKVQSTLRVNISKSGDDFAHKLELCTLASPTTPDPTLLAMTFRPALIRTLVGAATTPSFSPAVGDPVALPPFTIVTGSTTPCNGYCYEEDFIDSDNDGKSGVTIPAHVGPLNLDFESYAALSVQFWLITGTLQDASTISGDAAFGAHGQVLGPNNPLVTGGPIDVTPTSPTIPVSLKRLGAGDTPCSTVIQQLP